MPVLLSVLFSFLLGYIIYQDFRYRLVSINLLAGISLVCILFSLWYNSPEQVLFQTAVNLFLLVVQFLGVTAYFSLKKKKFVNIFNSYFGSADLWLCLITAFCFSPVNFIVFNVSCSFAIVLIYTFARFFNGYNKTIPFAGCFSIFLLVLINSHIWHKIDTFNDYFWALKFIETV